MEAKKVIELIDEMIVESKDSLTNCESTADRKNEAQVFKELCAARKGIVDSVIQQEKNIKDEEFKKRELDLEWCKKAHEERKDLDAKIFEEKRLKLDEEKLKLDNRWRIIDNSIKVGQFVFGGIVYLGCCGIAAITTNEGIYDQSLIRQAAMIPQELFVKKLVK